MKRLVLIFLIMIFPVKNVSGQEIVINHFCENIPEHTPQDDVEYKPGVDVNGKKVVPADLLEPIKPLVYPIEIPVDLEILEWLDIDFLEEEGVDIEPRVANLLLYEDGRIEYNGQSINDRAFYLCKEGQPPDQNLAEFIKTEDKTEPEEPASSENDKDVISGEAN